MIDNSRRAVPAAVADPSDEELLARFLAGDEPAFGVLVARHEGRVLAVCQRYFGNLADAQDAAQETFLVVYRRAGTFAGTARFSTWLYRVAVNACNDMARKRARRVQGQGGGAFELAAAAHDPLDRIEQLELDLDLRRALAELSPEYRDAVVRHSVDGVPYHEIAADAGVAVGTIKSRVHRGHALLAASLAHLRAREPSGQLPPPRDDP